MVKPWYEWLIVFLCHPSVPVDFMPSNEQLVDECAAVVGDDSIKVDLIRADKWIINEQYAESYSKGRV